MSLCNNNICGGRVIGMAVGIAALAILPLTGRAALTEDDSAKYEVVNAKGGA
jgi:hypothetical protein